MDLILRILISLFVVALTALFTYSCNLLLLKPARLRKRLQELGVNGPPPSFFVGNIPDVRRIMLETVKQHNPGDMSGRVSHDYMSQVFPHILKWQKDYGPTFSFSLGSMVVVCISDFDAVKEFCQNKSIEFGRSSYIRNTRGVLLGEDGLITSKGKSWAYQRKNIAPEFFNDKLKGMVEFMAESATSMVDKWDSLLNSTTESITVDEDLKCLSAEVISKACFGSNYAFGSEIFAKMLKLQDLLSPQYAFIGIPGFRHIPIKSNREIWKLGKEIRTSILEASQYKENGQARIFLQALVEHFGAGSRDLIVDNCKAMFLAGYETTATAAAFVLVLLGHHLKWQSRARDEVLEVLGGQAPTMEKLQKMKVLTMVIYETLRLYSPGPFIARETSEEMKFGSLEIPKGVNVWLPLPLLNKDPSNWGEDSNEFNPERFAKGISAACKFPYLFLPFGAGIRTCVGQNFAMMELKIILSLILSKFTFALSPEYLHRVTYKLFFKPEHGVQLKMSRI